MSPCRFNRLPHSQVSGLGYSLLQLADTLIPPSFPQLTLLPANLNLTALE